MCTIRKCSVNILKCMTVQLLNPKSHTHTHTCLSSSMHWFSFDAFLLAAARPSSLRLTALRDSSSRGPLSLRQAARRDSSWRGSICRGGCDAVVGSFCLLAAVREDFFVRFASTSSSLLPSSSLLTYRLLSVWRDTSTMTAINTQSVLD